MSSVPLSLSLSFSPLSARGLRTWLLPAALAMLAGLACHGAIGATAAARVAGPLPPVEDFYDNPTFGGASLSPSGKYLAARVGAKGDRIRLAVIELASNKVTPVAHFTDADIQNFRWVNDERLVFDVSDSTVAQGDTRYAPGLYAVNRDGQGYRELVSRTRNNGSSGAAGRQVLPYNTYLLKQQGRPESDFVYVTRVQGSNRGELAYLDLLRLNTVTGQSTTVERPGNVRLWLLDAAGAPRLAVTTDKSVSYVQYRDPADEKWRTLASFNTYTDTKGAFTPLQFGPDGTLYVLSQAGGDTQSVHTFNFATNSINPAPLVALPGYDFTGSLLMDKQRLLGVRYLTDTFDTTWLTPAMKAVQEQVDALLPGKANLLTPALDMDSPWVLVESHSDVTPGNTMLYNRVTKKLSPVGAEHPNIVPGQMGHQTLVHYPARDGLSIPAWLTLPHGQDKNLPLVVLVHGGPYVRGGRWGWNRNAQFLASRGYAVLEPEYRGSTGFGSKHYHAGWKQWGLKMQDDIADGAKWAIAKGTVDAKRICIAGASYGGYAVLMGLINDPGLFKCGVDWVGVTDINLLYDGGWNFSSDLSDSWKKYGMPELIGDQVKDAAQLKATSPLLRAAEIRQPLLLAYGGADVRVPLYHGTKFYNAVKAGNPDVEWIEYPEEGHGWHLPANHYDFWTRVEKFLDKHIGTPAP